MPELVAPAQPLTDGVVLLRPWERDDLPWLTAALQDPEVSRYSPAIPFPYSAADADRWFRGQEPRRLRGEELDFAITDASTGERLGAIGLGDISFALGVGEIGYWLAQSGRGRGAMSRAVRLVAQWAFDDLGLARVALTTDPENVASQRVAERCGFQREGLLRSHLKVFHSGERRDSLVYGLLPGELRAE